MTGDGSQPEDITLSKDGHFLYALLAGVGQVAAFRVESDGSLTSLGNVGGIHAMAGATGLAAGGGLRRLARHRLQYHQHGATGLAVGGGLRRGGNYYTLGRQC
jgi:hypothetical protein